MILWTANEMVDLEVPEGKIMEVEQKLMTIKEFCKYMSIGDSTARKILSEPNCPYACRIRGRIFINKTILDKWIDNNTGYR